MNQDTKSALILHRKLIRNKGILNKIYQYFYNQLKKTSFPSGPLIEIGSGAGFIKEIAPGVMTSDVIKSPGIDHVFSATKLPFSKGSVGGFLMIDVLHHIKDPEKALKEMERCLKAGGKIVMIEPFNSFWGGLIYQYVHPEKFDPRSGWKIEGMGRMSDSNTAIPWIIFARDRKIYEKKFPKLKIVRVYPHSPFKYLFSGGLTKFQFLPNNFYPFISALDDIVSKLFPQISMFATIELEKIGNQK